MAESFGVPVVGIGDELPNYAGDTLSGKVEMHDWIDEGQTFQPGEEIFSVILTFPSLENPVVLSELAWLGSPETQRELAGRKMRVLCVVSASKLDLKSFMGDCATLVEVEGWNLDSKIPLLIDDAGDFQRMLGCVRPGAADGLRGRVPSSLTLVVCPKHEVIFRSEYPITTGRNFVEMFRMLDSVRFTYAHPRLGTWANWQPGGAEGMLIMPSRDDGSLLSDEEATDLFPKGMFECLFPWFRITPVPDMPGDDDDVEEALAE